MKKKEFINQVRENYREGKKLENVKLAFNEARENNHTPGLRETKDHVDLLDGTMGAYNKLWKFVKNETN